MQQKKSINFGFRGWMLIIFQAIAFLAFTAFTNYPMNLLASSGFYGGFTMTEAGPVGTAVVSNTYTIAAIITIVIQLILSRFMSKIKNMKAISMILGAISLGLAAFITFYPPSMTETPNWLWIILYALEYITVTMYATFTIGVLIGQWFPRRKGTVMGIATLMFPIANALIGFIAPNIFAMNFEAEGGPIPKLVEFAMSGGHAGANTWMPVMLPFLIVCIVGWLIGLIFVKDYPEQCGCYRDNDKSITPEVAQKMMEEEIRARETTVWKTGHTLACRDFWFVTVPAGILLMFAVGAMTQTQPIFEMVGMGEQYSTIMLGIAAAGIVGSFVLGVIDTKIGTKKSMTIAMFMMLLSGILGYIGASSHNGTIVVVAFIILGLFMGASSNYTVSAAAQYWRREDFSSVFAVLNAIANLIQAFGPMLIANLLFGAAGVQGVFIACGIGGIVSVILILLFSPKNVKATDDKYRAAAGKPLDNELASRL